MAGLLLVPPTTAQGAGTDLFGDAVTTAGPMTMEADLASLAAHSDHGAGRPWTLTASQVAVQEHYRDHIERIPLVDISDGTSGQSEVHEVESPSKVSFEVGTDGDFWAMPGATRFELHSTHDTTVGPSRSSFDFPNRLEDEAPRWPAVDGSDLLSAVPEPPGGLLRLTGDIELLVFNTDLTVDGDVYWSGQGPAPAAGQEDLPEATNGDRIQVLQVWLTDAVLEIPLDDVSDLEVAFSSGSAAGDGAATITNPRGLKSDLLGDALTVNGPWRMDLARQGSRLAPTILEGAGAELDGQSYAIDPAQGLGAWWWLLVLFPLALIVYAVRPPASVLLRRLEGRLQAKDYPRVAATRISRLLRSRFSAKASLYRSTALLAMEEFQEASLFLASLSPGQRPDPATFHFLSAHAAAGLGSRTAALQHLQECFDVAPAYREDALNIPALRTVLVGVPKGQVNTADYV